MVLVFRGKRIRIQGRGASVRSGSNRIGLAAAAILAPCALLTFTMLCWNIAANMQWTSRFFVARGIFAHWQTWLIASAVLLLTLRALSPGERDSQ